MIKSFLQVLVNHRLKLYPMRNYFSIWKTYTATVFTIVAEARVRQLFTKLAKNPRARMRVAGGKCSYRRHYIQDYLKKQSIISGKLYIQCPSNKGRLRLNDQVTGRRYTFSNFHDTNIVAVPNGYRVMDVQFKTRSRTTLDLIPGPA